MRRVFTWSLGLAGLAVLLVLLVQLYYFAMTGWYARVDPSSTAFMRSRMALVHETKPDARMEHQWVPYARISDNLKRAVMVGGGVRGGGVRSTRPRARIKGGSTITQQLAKNLFLSGERSYLRKGQELVITYMLEFWMTKERILEIYLNVIEWGNGVLGAEAAARHYFGVGAGQLSVAQAARLAVMLPNPRLYDTNRNSAYLAQRSAAIQRWLPDADLP